MLRSPPLSGLHLLAFQLHGVDPYKSELINCWEDHKIAFM